jgi:uncharacterized protein (DUF952 family)
MAAQSATTLYHLLPAAEWEASQAAGKLYTPRTYAADGFVHLSADADALVDIGNHFYGSIPGDFLVLSLDASKLTSPVRWEPAAAVGDTPPHTAGQQLFPHLVRQPLCISVACDSLAVSAVTPLLGCSMAQSTRML